jgi:predicted DNA-binding protein with PD1-like motif
VRILKSMTYNFDGYNYLIRLERGEQLAASLEQFMQDTKIEGAWVSGVGGASEVILGFYDLDAKAYRWQTFTGLREITGIQGNLTHDEQDKMMFHLHGTFANEKYQTVGGHVKDLIAGATVELFVHRAYQPMHRKMDPEIGLQLLDLRD